MPRSPLRSPRPDWLTVPEVQARVGCCRRTVMSWVTRGVVDVAARRRGHFLYIWAHTVPAAKDPRGAKRRTL